MIAEHGADRYLNTGHHVRQRLDLGQASIVGQVTGEQQEIGVECSIKQVAPTQRDRVGPQVEVACCDDSRSRLLLSQLGFA